MYKLNKITQYIVIIPKKGCFTNLKKIHATVLELTNLEFLSKTELILIFLQATALLLISFPLLSEEIRVYALTSYLSISLVKILIYCSRRTSSNYNMKYLILLVLYIVQILVFICITVLLVKFKTSTTLQSILVISSLSLFSIIGFLNLTIVLKYIFYRHLKRVFPIHGEQEHFVPIKLKNLAPFMSIEKQGTYLVLQYGIHITIYGFYLYICLLAFKSVDFSTWLLFDQVHTYTKSWSFINSSNLIGLFSIFLAILTICLPIQRKIISEAEIKYMSKFNDTNYKKKH